MTCEPLNSAIIASDTMVSPIKSFSLKDFVDHPAIVMIAKRGSGMSWCVRSVIDQMVNKPINNDPIDENPIDENSMDDQVCQSTPDPSLAIIADTMITPVKSMSLNNHPSIVMIAKRTSGKAWCVPQSLIR
jgi:hypothetical protein